jgi:hypothetical protein
MTPCDDGENEGSQPRPVCRPSYATGKPKLLKQAIEVLLTDEQRPGAPATFTFEPFMQIMVASL